ncbi:MAG TPA: hypothetical protein VJG31_03925 [Candidatus Nanoarchaeia archaeon]|nr:hypothetical protein [Candidatus Nanoarchaeia archaeon]
MKIEDKFNQAVEEWITHCRNPQVQFSSSSDPIKNCGAFKKIVLMGYEALPLIRQIYDRSSFGNLALAIVQSHGLVSVVNEIVGNDFSIPSEIQGNIFAIEDYTKQWLDKNMNKYLSFL